MSDDLLIAALRKQDAVTLRRLADLIEYPLSHLNSDQRLAERRRDIDTYARAVLQLLVEWRYV